MSGIIIVAFDNKNGIGKNGKLPWHYPEDLRRFKTITTNNIVIYGRKTYDSLPEKYRPLPNRTTIVISKTRTGAPPTLWVDSILKAYNAAKNLQTVEPTLKIFIIGGESIYIEFLRRGLVSHMLTTHIDEDYNCDTHFPINLLSFFDCIHEIKSEKHDKLTYKTWQNTTNMEELQYLSAVEKVISYGEKRDDRTGVGTKSLFGVNFRFSLKDNVMPLLTTKPVYFKGVKEELIWFLNGDTDAKNLNKKGVKIWNDNGTREFLDSRGLEYPEGTLGPVYGWQWRNFNGPYNSSHPKILPNNKYKDQIKNIINILKHNPTSRRAILTSWNPNQSNEMALVSCHCMYHFWLSSKGLHCSMFQRSGDSGLGIPFNIASASLLTHLIAYVVGVKAYEFVHFVSDFHVYLNHIEPLKKQILRNPRSFPRILLGNIPDDLFNIDSSQIQLIDYFPCTPVIRMKMAI